VTVEQYEKFDEAFRQPAAFSGMADLPVLGTSWHQAAAYCNWLSKQEGIDPEHWCFETDPKGEAGPNVRIVQLRKNYLELRGYRLATEAELEYATRAGAVTSRYFGEAEDLLPKYGWYQNNSQGRTWPVGRLKPNDFGLFDVQGNVLSWCQESFKPNLRGVTDDTEDSLAIVTARVVRGGSFYDPPSGLRSAFRNYLAPSDRNAVIGFRVARTLPLDR
jgi:formylglycine-generating enzyme required for sulfatase activity